MELASIPSPAFQYLQIGPVRIFTYALCIILGVIIAMIVTGRRLNRRGGERGVVFDFTVWALVFGLIGARTYHVLTHFGDYFGEGKNPVTALFFWEGGIAIFGSMLGGALGVYVASRFTGVRFWSFADALVPGMLLAQAVGRFGNWFNHELFGGPTTLPWGLEIESSNPAFPVGLPEGTLFHPTFLYESLWNVLGVVVLLSIEKKLRPRWGQFFGLYLVWYGIGRAFTESLRVDPSMLILGLRTNVLAALVAVVLGLIIFFVQRKRHPGVEDNIYLPGRANPQENMLQETRDPLLYYHVLPHGTTPADPDFAEEGDYEPAAQVNSK